LGVTSGICHDVLMHVYGMPYDVDFYICIMEQQGKDENKYWQ
jgi:hypothetical protein